MSIFQGVSKMGFIRNMTMDTSNQEAERFYKMGIDYLQGTNGMPRNQEMALYCLKKAADLGSKHAKQSIKAIESDLKKTADIQYLLGLKRDASNQEAERFYKMGTDYIQGTNGMPRNQEMALYCLKKAANLGSKHAIQSIKAIGGPIMSGKENILEAERYFRRGWNYEHGDNIEADLNYAIECYKKSAELGSELAINRLKTLGVEYSGDSNFFLAKIDKTKTSDIKDSGKKHIVSNTYINNSGNGSKNFPGNILENLQNQLLELQNSAEKLYVVNAGRMNSGKSSLFNSLAKKKEMFPTKDVRTTLVQCEKKFTKDIYFIDTPGLDATDEDDKEAYAAYKKADLILFIHTPNIGEMHQSEIDNINKMAALFPRKEDFWKRFCLVFTFKEAMEDEDYEQIKDKSVKDIKKNCGNYKFEIFAVSNDDFWRGIDENEPELIELSGIEELKTFILNRTKELKESAKKLRSEKFENLKQDALTTLRNEKRKLNSSINKNREKIEAKHVKAKRMYNELMERKKNIDNMRSDYERQIDRLSNEIATLEDQHNRDKSRYYNY